MSLINSRIIYLPIQRQGTAKKCVVVDLLEENASRSTPNVDERVFKELASEAYVGKRFFLMLECH